MEANGEDVTVDRMFTDNEKISAYKLVILTSHGLDGSPKLILDLSIGVGSAPDGSSYDIDLRHRLSARLLPGCMLSGDHAFHAQKKIVVPYSTHEIMLSSANEQKLIKCHFNHIHSSEPMLSEHGNLFMQNWGDV